jgi:hypothetical protein
MSDVFLLGNKNNFTRHIERCLKEDLLEVETNSKLPLKELPGITIVNLFDMCEKIEEQLYELLNSETRKVIILENALNLYLNSKNELPYSVYTKVIPKNEVCERCLEIERRVVESKKQHVIFRISEMYGFSMPGSLVEQLLFASSDSEFENSSHDFIYDGDVISAIEVSLRKEVSGLFDIASGQSIEMRKLFELIKRARKDRYLEVKWKRKKLEVAFNCDNFKFYKWEPLVTIEMGLKTLLTIKKRSF